MREWALDRWSENTQIDLTKELLRIKAEIKIEREVEELAQQERDQKELIEDCTSLADLQVRWRTFISRLVAVLGSFLVLCDLLCHHISTTPSPPSQLHKGSRMYQSGPPFFLYKAGSVFFGQYHIYPYPHSTILASTSSAFFNTHPSLPPLSLF